MAPGAGRADTNRDIRGFHDARPEPEVPGGPVPGYTGGRRDQIGTGRDRGVLARGVVENPVECDSWPEEWRSFASDFNPDVAVIGSFVWDVFDRAEGQTAAAPGTPGYDAAYLGAVRQAVRVASRDGQVPTYVLGVPCLAATQDGYLLNDPVRRLKMNALIRAAIDGNPQARYVDLDELTCDLGARGISPERAKTIYRDGVHSSDQGGRLVWSSLLQRFAADGVAAAPGATASS